EARPFHPEPVGYQITGNTNQKPTINFASPNGYSTLRRIAPITHPVFYASSSRFVYSRKSIISAQPEHLNESHSGPPITRPAPNLNSESSSADSQQKPRHRQKHTSP